MAANAKKPKDATAKPAGKAGKQKPVKQMAPAIILANMSDLEESQDVVYSVLQLIIRQSNKLIHDQSIAKIALNSTAKQAVESLIQAIELKHTQHDAGESDSAAVYGDFEAGQFWIAEPEPEPCPIDRWARGVLPVKGARVAALTDAAQIYDQLRPLLPLPRRPPCRLLTSPQKIMKIGGCRSRPRERSLAARRRPPRLSRKRPQSATAVGLPPQSDQRPVRRPLRCSRWSPLFLPRSPSICPKPFPRAIFSAKNSDKLSSRGSCRSGSGRAKSR